MKKLFVTVSIICALTSCRKSECQHDFLDLGGDWHLEMSELEREWSALVGTGTNNSIQIAAIKQDMIVCTEQYLSELKVLKNQKGCDRVVVNGHTMNDEYYEVSERLQQMYLGNFN
jgi:hypothetical protein